MTLNQLKFFVDKEIEKGNGELQTVIYDPLKSEKYFKRETDKTPLTTIENISIVNDFCENKKAICFTW